MCFASVQPRAERVADAPDADAALDLAHDTAVLEHDDRGQRLDFEVLGELRSAIDVDPSERKRVMVVPLLQHLVEKGLDTAARARLRRIEVQQFGFGKGSHGLVFPRIRAQKRSAGIPFDFFTGAADAAESVFRGAAHAGSNLRPALINGRAEIMAAQRSGGKPAGIGVGGILVIVGIVLGVIWSWPVGIVVAVIGLVAFGGFAKGKWY